MNRNNAPHASQAKGQAAQAPMAAATAAVEHELYQVLRHASHQGLKKKSMLVEPGSPRSSARQKERDVVHTDRLLHRLALWHMYLALFGMALSIIEAELLFANEYTTTTTIFVLKTVLSVATAALVGVIVARYSLKFRLMRLRGLLHSSESFIHSGLLLSFCLELLVCAVHAPPGVDFVFDTPNLGFHVRYSVDHMCSLWQIARIYSIVTVFDFAVGYHTTQARVIAKWNDVSFNAGFTFKAMMERAPFLFFGAMFVVVTLAFSYALRVFEMPLCAPWLDTAVLDHEFCVPESYSLYDHRFFANSVWIIVITMTTVGYGDTFPVTIGGRAIVVIASLAGTAVVALIVSFVMGATHFQADERRAFNALYRTQARKKFLDAGAKLIQSVWLFYKLKRNAYRKAVAQYTNYASRQTGPAGRKGQIVPLEPAAEHKAERVHSHDAFGLLEEGLAQNIDTEDEHKSVWSTRDAGESPTATTPRAIPSRTRASVAELRMKLFGSTNHPVIKTYKRTVHAGMSRLLQALRYWKKRKAEYLDLHKEKSELAMIMKELLDLRLNTNEISEDTAGLNLVLQDILNPPSPAKPVAATSPAAGRLPLALQRTASKGALKRSASHAGHSLLGRLHGAYADDTLGMHGSSLGRKRSRQELAALRFKRRQYPETEQAAVP